MYALTLSFLIRPAQLSSYILFVNIKLFLGMKIIHIFVEKIKIFTTIL